MEVADVTLPAKFDFDTLVLHITHVAKRLGFAHIAWDRHSKDHAVGLLDEVIDTEGECILHEAEVDTKVVLLRLLPLEVGVGDTVGLGTVLLGGDATEEDVVAHRGEGGVGEVTDVLVTILTPAVTQLADGHPFGHVEEWFAYEVPTK